MSGGSKANASSQTIHKAVRALITSFLPGCPLTANHKLPGSDPHGGVLKVDFWVKLQTRDAPEGFYVQCFRQETGGSTAKKIAYDCDVAARFHDRPTLFVCAGSKSEPMLSISRTKVGGNFRSAMSLDQFVSFLADGAKTAPDGQLFVQRRLFG